jgi:hypothetical protein
MAFSSHWIGNDTDRQEQSRITTNCAQRVNVVQAIKFALAQIPNRKTANIIGEEYSDSNVHVIHQNDIVFYDTEEQFTGSQVDQQVTVFSTFNGTAIRAGMSNDAFRRRFRPYGVAAAHGVVEGMYESDRAGISVILRGTVTVRNTSGDVILPGQAWTCVPPNVDPKERHKEIDIVRTHSVTMEADHERYTGIIKVVNYEDSVTEFAHIVQFLFENTGKAHMRISHYDRTVDMNMLHTFSNVHVRALILKKFLAYTAFTSWYELQTEVTGTKIDEQVAWNTAVRLGLFDPEDGAPIQEDGDLQRRLYGKILRGQILFATEAFQAKIDKRNREIFPEAPRRRIKFVETVEKESRGKTLMRIANESADSFWRMIAKMTAEIGESVMGIAMSAAGPGRNFDAILS